MKAFKYIIAIILALALCVGVLIYAMGEQNNGAAVPDGASAGVSSGASAGTVVINEFMASNSSFVPNDKGLYSDWIELYNPTASAVSLSGLGLSDDNTNIKWAFPDVAIPAGGYLVVFASGDSATDAAAALHTNFKLNASSGSIYLTNGSGEILDEIGYENQAENMSMGRSIADMTAWTAFDKATPGYANDEAGYAAFQQSRVATDKSLKITEVMASNNTTLTDNNGVYSDYIEIYNSGSAAVSLTGYGLSDDAANVLGWKFPDVTIEPGAYLVVFASGEDLLSTDIAAGAIHTNFRISSYQETIVLSSPQGLIIDQVSMTESQSDQSYARVLDESGAYGDTWAQTSQPTPGYANTEEAYAQFLEAHPIALGAVVVSEVMVSNSQYLEEADGEFYDWIELHNQSDQAVDITGYGLTNNPKNPAKWRMPSMTLAPGGYVTVMASGLADDENVKKNYVHTNFKLSAAGEVLVLFDANGVLQDKYNLQTLPYGVSIGRMDGQGALFYFQQPSPGAVNTSPLEGIVTAPEADIKAGSYASAQQVTFTCDTEEAQIYYTTDGTEPTKSSTMFSGALSVSETSIIRTKAFKDGFLDSPSSSSTYIIGKTHSLPVISIVTDPENLWNEETGIYAKGADAETVYPFIGANFFNNWEKPASFEVFDETGASVFAQNIGIRIAGGYSRGREQKAFAIYARPEFGPSAMKYSFFENRPYTEYQSILLRQGGQDQNISKIKEIAALSLVEGQGFNFINQAYKPYVLYLNGDYWGVYYMMEKRNEEFIAQHEGVEDSDNMNILKATSIVLQGTDAEYTQILDYIETHDMSQQENYDYVAARIDTDSFMDLMICEIWVANTDYANLQFYQILPEGKWKQVYYDFCWSFGNNEYPEGNHPTLAKRMDNTKTGSTLFNGFLAYKPWKDKFIERFAWALKEIYNPARVLAAIDAVADSIRSEMPAEREKFGGTVEGWEASVESMRNFANKRGADIVQQLKSTFSLSEEQIAMLDDAIK